MLKKLRRSLQRLNASLDECVYPTHVRIENMWQQRCLLSEQHQQEFERWAPAVRRSGLRSKEVAAIEARLHALRAQQYRLAEALGISDASAVIVAKRDNEGKFASCPRWVMEPCLARLRTVQALKVLGYGGLKHS